MKRTRALTDPIVQAAELRAGGAKWSDVAAKIGCPEANLHQWIQNFPKQWAEELRKAEQRTLGEAGAEAVLRLRTMLRSPDDDAAGVAAKAINGLVVEHRKLDLRAPDSPPPPSADTTRLVAFIQGQPDEHLRRIVLNFFPDAEARLQSACDPAGDPGPN